MRNGKTEKLMTHDILDEVWLQLQCYWAGKEYTVMYDLYLDVLFMRVRQHELSEERALQALRRQAQPDTPRRQSHVLLAIRDHLTVLGPRLHAAQKPRTHQRHGISMHAPHAQQVEALGNAVAMQESGVAKSEGCDVATRTRQ
jgi:hypothetical protein